MNIHQYPKHKFIKVSTNQPVDGFLYKTHHVSDAGLIKVKNPNVSSGLLNFYDLRLGRGDGVHVGYYIETPYSVNVTCNFLMLRRTTSRLKDYPQLSFKLPSVCIYTLGASAMVLVSDMIVQPLFNTITV